MSTAYFKSFAAGEISPRLYGRVDLSKFQTGLRTLRNFFVMRDGGASNRPGPSFVGQVKDMSKRVRLVPFVINRQRAYVLEFGDEYMRVLRNGEYIMVSAKTITAITKAAAAVVSTSTFHGFKNGDLVSFSGIAGMVELNGLQGTVTVVGAGSFSVNINSTGFTTYTSGGTVALVNARPVEVVTPYDEDQVREMTVTNTTIPNIFALGAKNFAHQSGLPQTLLCYGDESWFLSAASFVPKVSAPTNVVNTGAAGSATSWVVTAVKRDPLEESIPSSATSTSAVPSSASPETVSWTAVSGAIEYNVYKSRFGVYGFIGSTTLTNFVDDGYVGAAIDVEDNPPETRIPFGGATGTVNFPAAVGFYQQRIFYGNIGPVNETGGLPALYDANWDPRVDGIYSSRIGLPNNFNLSRPTLDDDPLTFRLLGRERNEIRHLVDLGKLAAFTSVGEWVMEGDSNGALTPSVVNPRQYSDHGCSMLAPIVVWGGAVFIQDTGSVFRSFGFDFSVDGYRGNDLTTFSSHLVDGHTIDSWALQKSPNPIIWSVRDDGTLLGVTFAPEQQLLGWHRHDFAGATVEDVCCIPEGDEDVLYLAINHTIEGDEVRYVERMNTRKVDAVEDCVFVDSAFTYDGWNTDEDHTMTLSGGTTWEDDETITLTSSDTFFDAGQIGCKIHLNYTADPNDEDDEDDLIRFEIIGFTNSRVVTGRPQKLVPEGLRSEPVSDWALAVSVVDGLGHLEGENVSVLGDGFVVANPNNPDFDLIEVNNEQIDLPDTYAVIHVGKPIVADIETLNIDVVNGETMIDRKKLITRLTVLHESSRGFWAGGVAPDDDSQDPTEGLTTNLDETKVRYDEGYDEPVALRTGTTSINIQAQWNSHGRIFIRQIDPLPLAILSIAPAGSFG